MPRNTSLRSLISLIPALAYSAQLLAADPSANLSAAVDDRRDQNLDWVTYAPLDAENLVCKGRYLEPQIWSGLLAPDSADSSVVVDADQSSSELGAVSVLRGNVIISEAGRQAKAEYAEIDQASEQALLRYDVRYREPGLLITADSVTTDLSQRQAIASEARYVLHNQHLRGDALMFTRYGDQRIEAQQTEVTFCEPGNNDWSISAKEMVLRPAEGYGETWHTRFNVGGVPVFYLPYFYFPLDDTRRSGFLYPYISSGDVGGLDLAVPYYFNIATNIDDTLTPRLIEKRGVLLENELRYLTPLGMNTLNTTWLPEDDLTNKERWLFDFSHSGSPAPRWSADLQYTRVSDNAYFDDLTPVDLRVPSGDDLPQRLSLSYAGSGWTANALVNDYQHIGDDEAPYARLPQLSLIGRQPIADLHLGYQLQYTDFQHDNPGLVDGQRIHLRPAIGYDLRRTWGFIKPEIGLWHSQYQLSNSQSPERTNHFATLDSGLMFERQGELMTQTLEPRIKLIHVDGDPTNSLLPNGEFFDSTALGFSYSNLFDDFGFSGNDRIAQTEQASLSLGTRLYSLSGRQLISAGVAQAHYFSDHDPRPGDLSGQAGQSDFAVNLTWRPSDALQLGHDSRVSHTTGTLLEQNYRLFYYPDSNHLFYGSYRKAQSETSVTSDQLDLATRWPLTTEWSGVARWTQDLEAEENIETLLGVEYQSCCWKVRLTAKQYIVDSSTDFERENAFFIQFVLRGLGSLGQSEGRSFLRDLTGFNEDANENF